MPASGIGVTPAWTTSSASRTSLSAPLFRSGGVATETIGDGANDASRLEALNLEDGTWMLASRTTRAPAGPGLAWRRVDLTKLADRAVDDDVLELLGLEGEVAPTAVDAPPAGWTGAYVRRE